jgi:hypothetical protein
MGTVVDAREAFGLRGQVAALLREQEALLARVTFWRAVCDAQAELATRLLNERNEALDVAEVALERERQAVARQNAAVEALQRPRRRFGWGGRG